MHTITARNLTKSWGEDTGLFDLDLDVEEGEIVALIGPSGSGKTTTVRLCTGILEADSGTIELLGENPARMGATTRQRIGYLPQENVLYPTLTVRENLKIAASIYGLGSRQRKAAIENALELVDLTDAGDRRMADASGGMRRRASLAAALVHSPDVLFLDEPTAGLDPVLRRAVWDHFGELKDNGTTLIVTTQYVGEAAFCDEVGVLSDGRLLALMPPEELRSHAYGGELLDVTFDSSPSRSFVEEVAQRIDGTYTGTGPQSVRFLVADSGTATPLVSEVGNSHGVNVVEAERFVPEFDDVFVKIVSST